MILMSLLISAPGVLVAELLLWFSGHSGEFKWTITVFLVLGWMFGTSALHTQILRPLQTLSNMVAAIREDDFSFRLRGAAVKTHWLT